MSWSMNESDTHLQNIRENTKKYIFFSSTHVSFFKTDRDHVFSTQGKTQQTKENQNNVV